MEQVEVIGSKIVVHDLTLEDQEAAYILGEHPAEEQLGIVKQALRFGLLLRRQVSTAVNVDFVKREFQNLQHEIQTYWREEVKGKIDETIVNYFDTSKGMLPRQLARYFGDGEVRGKLDALFDEKNTESITYQLRQMLQNELTGEGSTFLKALNPDDEKSPIGQLKRKLEASLQALRDDVVAKKAADEMAETGTQKGGPYEDLVFEYIDQIAGSFGDSAEDVSNQSVAGDYVVTLDPETVPGHRIRLAIDAKDTPLGLKACEDTLRAAKGQWDAQAALLVFARQEQTPFAPPVGLRKLGEGYVCVFDKEDLDSRVLQAAYQVARLEAVRAVQRVMVQIEPALVQEKLEQAVQKLQEFVTLKRRLTGAITELGSIRQFTDTLHRECREKLEEAWLALGVQTPMPTVPEESS